MCTKPSPSLAFLFLSVLAVQCTMVHSTVAFESNSSSNTARGSMGKFEALRICLMLAGVADKNIVPRDTPLNSSSSRAKYDELNYQWDALHGTITPLAYLVATRTPDVQAAVRCCRQSEVRVVALSGGHSYLKYGFGDENSLIVDMKRFNVVKVDKVNSVAVIGPGTRGGKVQYALWAQGGYLTASATCTTVAIAGFAMGGGYGFYSRLHGLAADNLVEARMVDANGRLLIANSETNPDLYWALRGGGGGNFGIVTNMKFKVYPAPKRVVYAIVEYLLTDFARFFKAWQTFLASPSSSNYLVPHLEVPKNKNIIRMSLYHHGDGLDTVQQVLATQFPPAVNRTVHLFTYPDWMLFFAQQYSDAPLTTPSDLLKVNHESRANTGWKKVKSIYVDRLLTRDEDLARLQALVIECARDAELDVEPFGPQSTISAVAPSDTAFVHRGRILFNIELRALRQDGKEDKKGVDAMIKFFEGTKPLWHHTQSYQNYLDEDLPDYLQRYYGTNLKRLMAIKKQFDPDNVFNYPQSIPAA